MSVHVLEVSTLRSGAAHVVAAMLIDEALVWGGDATVRADLGPGNASVTLRLGDMPRAEAEKWKERFWCHTDGIRFCGADETPIPKPYVITVRTSDRVLADAFARRAARDRQVLGDCTMAVRRFEVAEDDGGAVGV